MHMYNVAQVLLEKGHKVIVLTSSYNERTGVRYISNGLKVYYLPVVAMARQTSFVDLLTWKLPIFRYIWIKEEIDIVHGHQAASVLMIASLVSATLMGLRTVFTDHSLFGFADAASIQLNKVIKWAVTPVDAVICVS